MQFPDSILEEIKSRISLSDIVGRYVSWDRRKSQPSKQDYWACCPFHHEKTPSFHVDDRRQLYKCFGCEAGGSHFQFLMQKEGLSFSEAVERLAHESGVALPKPDPRQKEKEQAKATLAEICEMACKYFEDQLKKPESESVRTYLRDRGIEPKTQDEFRIGFAPDRRTGLMEFLRGKGVEENSMLEAGLIGQSEDGRESYDRFRGRIIIPIQDDRGRVVAFGGRTLNPEGMPKYLNSPETPLFQKRFMLFNYHRARQHAFDNKNVIVVEGYLDAIAIWQAGIKHVVASLGTSFTEQQIAKLWRVAPEPTICFDGDSAGVKAAHRAIDRILSELKGGYSFNFVLLPAGQDPDDLIQERGSSGLLDALDNSVTLSDLLWEREIEGKPIDTPERKSALERNLYACVAQIRDETVKKSYKLEIRLRLSNYFWQYNRRVFNSRDRTGRNVADTPGGTRVVAPLSELFGIERTFCALCMKNINLLERYMERISRLRFANELHQRFNDELNRFITQLSEEHVSDFFDGLDKKFYAILDEVLTETPETAGETGLTHKDRFFLLNQRLPILNYDLEPDFIENVFVLYLENLELRNLENEIRSDTKISIEKLEEKDWVRIQKLKLDLDRYRTNYRRREEELVETARKIQHSRESSAVENSQVPSMA